ncbi:ubiquitin-conjugating enzyme E2 Q1-like isoform X2 [Trachypithecus francoisi]|uniref:ubiquitin-conjugating enzyme E2 Q1-like isoform X2 n=1 Tax=Trachypithecus francoisi TaxID=54180 RepID=UPI00141A8A58|nr:ubiquitin-conjugating enzyme E2 Q1-like isoform X2 [Trachypithecus francoisi]XP_033044897.1 ubiquitin-conjugating enzyme E2 Q1-like isoform X2 [Trachypithecus francoisi]
MQPLVLFERSLSPRPDRCCVLERHIVPWMWQDIEDLDHYEMKEEPMSGKQLEDDGTEKENWAILEKIRKTERYVLDGGALCMEPLTKRILLSRMKKG